MEDNRRPEPQPTVSRVFEDGTLVELLYDPAARVTALAVRSAAGEISRTEVYEATGGERLKPYSAANTLIASDCILLPSAAEPFVGKAQLLAEVRAFLRRYLDLSPLFEAIAAHYVLLSWVYDAFSDVPYLRFRGDYGTGKTRALLTLGHLCYKPFFASGASTVSPIFHILDVFQGTLILDEADLRFSDATADLIKVLNNGTMRGLPVLRTMVSKDHELNPRAFRVFGPKLVGMRGAFADPALESRFLTEETGAQPLRPEVPLHLPKTFQREARAVRNQLLAFRLTHFHDYAAATLPRLPGLDPRTQQTALALLALVDDDPLRAAIVERLAAQEATIFADRSQTLEAAVVAAALASLGPNARFALIGDLTRRVNAARTALGEAPLSARAVGNVLRQRLRLRIEKTRGFYGVPASERPKLEALARRFHVSDTPP